MRKWEMEKVGSEVGWGWVSGLPKASRERLPGTCGIHGERDFISHPHHTKPPSTMPPLFINKRWTMYAILEEMRP